MLREADDIGFQFLQQIYSEKYPEVNILISVGGWTDCGYFSEMAYTAVFAESENQVHKISKLCHFSQERCKEAF